MLVHTIMSVAVLIAITVVTAVFLRRVVPTNEVHIVQSARSTTSYGNGTENGNTYYDWPSWIPLIGITKTSLPVSVFNLNLNAYEAYDKDRVPFVVDIVAFYRIENSNIAARSVENFSELELQLKAITQGAIRTVLASHDINEIMVQRSQFGEKFTQEVSGQLANWGVTTVKNIELMDIRDAVNNQVVHNIMSMKKSEIEMLSRSTVANNMQKAQTAEITAKQNIELQNQEALESVGKRTAAKEKNIGIAQQQSQQAVKEEERNTMEKEMAVQKVQHVTEAEIAKSVSIVTADQKKQTAILEAEGTKQVLVLQAEGKLEQGKREAEITTLNGDAKASAERALQLAPVMAQITLAKEIGQNASYQNYLVIIRKVEADQVVGIEQAKALQKAEIQVIANSGTPANGVKTVMDLFSSAGGTNIGAMLEGLAQTETGAAILGKLNKGEDNHA